MTLDKKARDAIGRVTGRLRDLFEEEFHQQATGRFGIHLEPRPTPGTDVLPSALRDRIEPVEALSLNPRELRQREELLGALIYLVQEGASSSEAVERLLREAAFTTVNRLLAVRVAEAIGVLPPALSGGRQSSGYRDVVGDLFPALGHEEDEGFWFYLQVCGDELGASVPLLFDRRSPVSAFVPRRPCIDAAVDMVNGVDVAAVWAEPEALGWAYQFFNSEDERAEMRSASAAPRTPHELAVRNQFFTPRYVVDWLVQNTLGRRLRQAGFHLDLPLLVGDVGSDAPLGLEDVRVLDPAVGSGHFLLGCYDLLEEAWQSRGVSPADAASTILGCLHGIEIDPRASQVAQVVLLLRARRAGGDGGLSPPAIVTARALPRMFASETEDLFEPGHAARRVAAAIAEALRDAPALGSLLKVEIQLETELTGFMGSQPTLTAGEAPASVEELEEQILEELHRLSRSTEVTAATRMFTADASDAIRFVELSQLRYDVVLMNPPFGDPLPHTADYLKSAYREAGIDVYAAFVARGVDLLREEGYVGAITSRTGFFMTSFEAWRTHLVLPRLYALLDLGVGVMHKAMVEAAAYVAGKRQHRERAVFRRLLDKDDKAAAVYDPSNDNLYYRRPSDFTKIPGAPAAYWLDEKLIQLFASCEPLSSTADVKQGLATAHDFRFLRLWWEIPPEGIGRNRRWVPFAKGGEYSPYYSDLHLVVDWEDDGSELRAFERSFIRNDQYYYRPGLTWSLRSQKGFSTRPVPSGSIFGHKGPMIFVQDDDPKRLDRLMAYLNSKAAAALLETLVAFGSYEVGSVGRLPGFEGNEAPGRLAEEISQFRRELAQRDELDHNFVSPWTEQPAQAPERISARVDESIDSQIGTSNAQPESATYPTEWFHDEFKPSCEVSLTLEVSYLIGVALGRWDIRQLRDPPSFGGSGRYDPLPSTSPGMLTGSPSDYPLDLPGNGVLVDDERHRHDVVSAIRRAGAVAKRYVAGPSELQIEGHRDLRKYLRTEFFGHHAKHYSASRRYGPIYWHLTVPSQEWGVWVYLQALSRETLFAIATAGDEKLRRFRDEVERVRSSSDAKLDRSRRERIESLEELAAEVESFAEHARRVANSGWVPDLNDGAILVAAPFEPLFQDNYWLEKLQPQCNALVEGEYPWAAVQRDYFEVGA